MFALCVTIHVKPPCVPAFVEATLDNARNTRKEPANIRFDVVQSEEDPALFLLYEVYVQKDDFVKHQQTEHYLRWKQAVADFMAQPRTSVKAQPLFFGDGQI